MGRRKEYPFHISDVDFGANLVSSLLTAPIALMLATASSIDNYGYDSVEYKEPTLSDKERNYNIDAQLIGNLSSNKYRHLKNIYNSQVAEISIIKKDLLEAQKKSSRLYKIVKFLGFIPFIKRSIGNKILDLNNSINLLLEKSYEPSIPISKVCDKNEKSDIPKLSGYSFVFGELRNYAKCDKRLFWLQEALPFFKIDSKSIVALNCEYLQLHLLDSCLIIMTQKDFSIIEYNDINSSYCSQIVSEDSLKSTEGLKVILKTWEHSCKDGSADLRYKYNSRIYLVEYGKLTLNISNSFSISILFNDYNVGNAVYRILATV